jgi:hypothetical protein
VSQDLSDTKSSKFGNLNVSNYFFAFCSILIDGNVKLVVYLCHEFTSKKSDKNTSKYFFYKKVNFFQIYDLSRLMI